MSTAIGIITQKALGVITDTVITVSLVQSGIVINNYEGGSPGDISIADVDGLEDALDDKQPLAAVLTATTASFTIAQANKLEGIEDGAEVNVIPSWTDITGKPSEFPPSAHTHAIADIINLIATLASMVDAIDGKQPLATVLTDTTASFTGALLTKLNSIESGAQVNVAPSWAALTGMPAPISSTTAAFTTSYETKLSGIEANAQVNVDPAWAAITGIPAVISGTTASFTVAYETKLNGIESGAQVNVAPAWASLTGVPAVISGTTASFTAAKDTKLSGIETGAQVNVTPTIAGVTGLTDALLEKQSSLWAKVVYLWAPTTATAGLWINTAGSGNGTFSNGLPAAGGSIYAGMKRAVYGNVITTLNQVLGQRTSELLFHIGSVANKGGFKFRARFGFSTWANGGRMFAGMSSTTNNVVTADPSANLVTMGFAVDSADNGLIYFMARGSGSASRTSTGLTIASLNAFDVGIDVASNGTSADYWIKDLETGTLVTGNMATNLPANTSILSAAVLASNAALTPVNSIQLGVARIYIETDY